MTTGDDGAVKPLSEMIAELKPLVDANPVELIWAAIGRGEISVEIVSEIAVALRADKAALTAQLQAANETWIDDYGTVWTPPTAEAYARVCKARDKWQRQAELAQAEAAVLLERVSTLYKAIEHGDDKHRMWLVAKLSEHFCINIPLAASLLSELTALREALRPFASLIVAIDESADDCDMLDCRVVVEQVREAAALTRTETTDG